MQVSDDKSEVPGSILPVILLLQEFSDMQGQGTKMLTAVLFTWWKIEDYCSLWVQ